MLNADCSRMKPSVAFRVMEGWVEVARWVNAEDAGVEVAPGVVSMGGEISRGLVERATSWPGPGLSRDDEVIHEEYAWSAVAHAKSRGCPRSDCQTMHFLCGFAPWREVFHAGVRHSSHHWGKGSCEGAWLANVRPCISFAALRLCVKSFFVVA